ncbi:hypothetical protein Sulac_3534 (plasmid) [Sulfobacillus acidophilus DSM 10332]|uniref:Uncharacterized protein n=1 Tax=Sulfobacillus acidophilus (strain ATCC 700253 / DSM 10332 / NAL) TaxID=679936 RepID=G8U1P2_SULAD|nr:hypothetical protein Sulac_3534 [Sulfobacillus acidophilus DSM 10332]
MAHYQITLDAQTIQALVGQKDNALALLLIMSVWCCKSGPSPSSHNV